MLSIGKLIDNILKGKDNFCCLCLIMLNRDNENSVKNEVVIEKIGVPETKQILDLIQIILGEDIEDYTNNFHSICNLCVNNIINYYTFTKKSISNINLITKAIHTLSESVKTIENDDKSKSLYVSLDLNQFNSEQFYDKRKIATAKSALDRYKFLKEKALENEFYIDYSRVKRKKNVYYKINLPDMLHDPKDSLTMKCKYCLKTYPSKWCLKSHYLRVHAPKIYKCTKCPLKYSTKHFLDTHERASHIEMACSQCGEVYSNKHTLKVHEMSHNLSLVCPDCGRKYKNKTTYQKHIEFDVCKQECRADPANAKFTCDYCNKKYTQKVSLRVHIQFEHGNYKVHVCNWCNKKFWAQSRLKAHIVKHTRERNFVCSVCENKFVTKEALLYHTRLHTGEKPYKCMECEKRFLSSSRRNDHIKRCHSGTLYQCSKCINTYNSYYELNEHQKSHALIEDNGESFISQDSLYLKLENMPDNELPLIDFDKDLTDDVYNFI